MPKRQQRGCLSQIFAVLFDYNTPSEPQRSDSTTHSVPQRYPFGEYVDFSDSHLNKKLPYRVRDDFLSAAEHSFFKVLSNALQGKELIIFTKVNLNDVFYVTNPNKNLSYRGKIAQKHVDFLICSASDLAPIVGIELDDRSHKKEARVVRDEFVDGVFKSAELPLLRFPAQHTYNTTTLREEIQPYLEAFHLEMTSPPAEVEAQSEDADPVCPRCGGKLIIRRANKGAHKGQRFYGCENYPKCRKIAPLDFPINRS